MIDKALFSNELYWPLGESYTYNKYDCMFCFLSNYSFLLIISRYVSTIVRKISLKKPQHSLLLGKKDGGI
jgi:hypothetical protein